MESTLTAPARSHKGPRPSAHLPTLIGSDLLRVEQTFQQTLDPYRGRFPRLIEHLAAYQGKRLRPSLMLLVGKGFGRLTHAHDLLAASLEMIHTATLVHDDVLDEADLRRHTATINARHGNKISILLGDLLFTSAFHLSSKVGDAQACEAIGEATNRVCAGELQQTMETGNFLLGQEAYFSIIDGKTAALTECAARLGAVYAGATPQQAEQLAVYGRCLGIAFQIADDLLDLVGDPSEVGKTLGTDLLQTKMTLPMIYLFDRLSDAESLSIRESLGRRDEEVRDLLVQRLNETNSIQDARRTAIAYVSQAQRALQAMPAGEYRDALEKIAEWSLNRDR